MARMGYLYTLVLRDFWAFFGNPNARYLSATIFFATL
jgi:hypothetical protein